MDDLMRKLPIGIQTFEDIRRKNYLYVDKTALVWRMANLGKPYFLSRPRRFGKSLLLSTFKAYFQGKKELFEGLAIEKLETEWNEYPVLHLDLNAEKYDKPEKLKEILSSHLTQWEIQYGKGMDENTLSRRFEGIIRRAYEQTGSQVAVLIDEYDKPLLQAISQPKLLDDYRQTLKAFYGVLKSADPYLHFVLLTGVTKFSQVSVFSDLNQLNDISLDYSYATLCGITRKELTTTFEPEIAAFGQRNQQSPEEVVAAMERNYDGYHFHPNGEGVFNPFSVLNAFSKLEISNYWFQTGTPTFLVELLQKSEYDLRTLLDGIEAPASSFAEYRMDAHNPIPLIYQSGYLTIKDYDKEFQNYLLAFPNDEVRYGFINFLVPFYTPMKNNDQGFYIGKFVQELRSGDYESFLTRLEAFFADIPYELNERTERHYQVIFYLVFKLMGQFTEAEVRSARGRADAVVKTPKYIYVFEFKLKGTAEEALKQIDDKGYLIPYQADQREVVKIGVEFSAESRNLSRWLVERQKR
ncbi:MULTISPECIES: ATP-binding protein [Bacteroides]|mgnify:FL=1|uniref:ATP-binding protein n=1 Tax=Bacteroides TaxID=816 RepID=UPI0022E59B8C|nr:MULTISPECIES: ATP-binding protein [Bacteroides]